MYLIWIHIALNHAIRMDETFEARKTPRKALECSRADQSVAQKGDYYEMREDNLKIEKRSGTVQHD